MPSGVGVRRVEEPFHLCLGAVGFYTCASSIQTGGGGMCGGEEEPGLSLTDVILHSHLLHFPSSSPFSVAPNLGYSRSCVHT